jgi:hypothetical protein
MGQDNEFTLHPLNLNYLEYESSNQLLEVDVLFGVWKKGQAGRLYGS